MHARVARTHERRSTCLELGRPAAGHSRARLHARAGGPAASLALADLGAEVIKIEPPGSGDETRTFPPFRDGESHYFLSVNRGKKSIVVDLKTDAGVALAKDLAAKCDILDRELPPRRDGSPGPGL